MKAHVQNPWTRSPQLFVHMTVEEVHQLYGAMCTFMNAGSWLDRPNPLSANERAAVTDLMGQLRHALGAARPDGLKGVLP